MSLAYLLQIQALREALERSARTCQVADERNQLTARHLKREIFRGDALEVKVRDLEARVREIEVERDEMETENRRLRNLIGKAAQDKDCANSELRALIQEVQDLTPRKSSTARRRSNAA